MLNKIFIKNAKFILIGLFILCTVAFFIHKWEYRYDPNFKYALIYANSYSPRSYIEFYDDNMKKVGKIKINVGGLCVSCERGQILNNKFYAQLKGTDYMLQHKILELDLKTGKYNLLDSYQGYNLCLAVNKDYIAVANASPQTHIVRIGNHGTSFKTISFEDDTMPTNLLIHKDKLYAFCANEVPPISNLYQIDLDKFEIEKTIDVNKTGQFHRGSFSQIGDDIYFSNNSTYKPSLGATLEHPASCHSITKCNLQTGQMSDIELKKDYPYDVLHYKGKLYISHRANGRPGDKITVYDLKTGQQEVKTLDLPFFHMEVGNGKICTVSEDHGFNVYDVNTFEKVNEIKGKKHPKYLLISLFVKP